MPKRRLFAGVDYECGECGNIDALEVKQSVCDICGSGNIESYETIDSALTQPFSDTTVAEYVSFDMMQ